MTSADEISVLMVFLAGGCSMGYIGGWLNVVASIIRKGR